MANEVRGLLYETITHYALLKAVQASNISGEVFWNEKPNGMSINPDFTIGKNRDHVSHVILVTASGSSRNAEMKSWRNLGETFEAKLQLPQVPIAINLYYKSEVKKGLSEAVDSLYDSTVHFDNKKYFAEIKNWVENNIGLAGSTKELRAEHFEHAVASNVELASSIELLIKDITTVLTVENLQLDSLWSLMAEDYKAALLQTPFAARNTYVKRGIGKLMVLEQNVRECLYKNYKKSGGIKGALPSYCFELGFFTKTLAGARLVDDEIKGAIALLGQKACELIIAKSPKAMDLWLKPLRNLSKVGAHVEFVYDNYEQLTSSEGLKKLLLECFHDPVGMSSEDSDEKLWLFEIMVSLIKTQSGKFQGYGLAKMAKDFDISEVSEGQPLLRFLLPKFTQRQELPDDTSLEKIATGLASRFSNDVDKSDISKLKDLVSKWVIKENLEDRLIPYRNFEPVLWLLEAELKKHAIDYEAKCAYTGWINEYAEVGKRSATTPFVRVGNTYIHWKTVSDAGRGHKKKELAARARAFKYQYDVESEQFIRRNGLDKLVLLVDGTFDDKDLRALQTSGWDLILYPDEISGFVADLAK
ncbi:MAG: hypothetical protein GJ680_21275 [Alteromonadaceae bacterium]|nr:hypothetical protein [Alteromonadaceae bacterium]